jgi:hypothetical protein
MRRTAEAVEKFTNPEYFVNTCVPEKHDPKPLGNVTVGRQIAATCDSVVLEVTLDTEDKQFIAKYGMDSSIRSIPQISQSHVDPNGK